MTSSRPPPENPGPDQRYFINTIRAPPRYGLIGPCRRTSRAARGIDSISSLEAIQTVSNRTDRGCRRTCSGRRSGLWGQPGDRHASGCVDLQPLRHRTRSSLSAVQTRNRIERHIVGCHTSDTFDYRHRLPGFTSVESGTAAMDHQQRTFRDRGVRGHHLWVANEISLGRLVAFDFGDYAYQSTAVPETPLLHGQLTCQLYTAIGRGIERTSRIPWRI